jgi:hypothetical protein
MGQHDCVLAAVAQDTAYTPQPMHPDSAHPRWRFPWGLLVFLLAFAGLILIVSRWYLLPAAQTVAGATPQEQRLLTATSRLLLAVILFVIGAGIVITFRVGRFFFPRPSAPAKSKTQYIDAWSESAKRMKQLPADDEDDETE